jgi:HEAT repeat protein
MPRRKPLYTISTLPPDTAQHLQVVRSRHTNRKSACGALLADILSDGDLRERWRSAHAFGSLGCSRGIQSLLPLIEKLESRVIPPHHEHEAHQREERELFHALLMALGFTDCPAGHAVLERLVTLSSNPIVRADALEAMAFEEEQFDLELVLPFVSSEATFWEIISALYALLFKGYARKNPGDAFRRIAPLLLHEHPMVRVSAIEVLQEDRSNQNVILELKDDPSEVVRQVVDEARFYWAQDWS